MDFLKLEHIYKDLITSLFGTLILVGAGIYFFSNLKDISFTEIGTLLAIGAVGALFLFGDKNKILSFLPGSKPSEPTETNLPK
jgi:hypothetical protein